MPLKNSHGALDTTEVNEISGLGPVVLGELLFKNGEGFLGTKDIFFRCLKRFVTREVRRCLTGAFSDATGPSPAA
ncbi:hypothetical protein [Kitasatospora purpeofusca]|uniref:hypothetical protein n=1 Tax=Kitasatospora purpeofusca TaxID=67352 RepID=UPI00365FF8A3